MVIGDEDPGFGEPAAPEPILEGRREVPMREPPPARITLREIDRASAGEHRPRSSRTPSATAQEELLAGPAEDSAEGDGSDPPGEIPA